MAVNFSKNQEEITNAWKNVVDTKNDQSWALFGYEGNTNNIRLMSTGTNGLGGLVGGLNCSLIQYGFCRVIDQDLGLNKLILINWQGDSSPLSRKGLCASHVADVTNYFKGCTQTITIRNDDEATVEYLMEQITKSSATSRINFAKQPSYTSSNNQTAADLGGDTPKVGSTYSKTNVNSDIPADRKSFWQRQEEEEKERLMEEKKRAAEKQAQFEKERKAREETEAKKLAEAIKERDRLIDATRQAERRESSASQASASAAGSARDDDDERVGRRSELLRLERNQETQSLIEKGLIKNKRAIFEQAASQQQQQASANNMPRKSSGTMVAQRLNSFKSLESSSSLSSSTSSNNNPQSIEKLSNGFSKQVSLNNESEPKSIVSEKVEIIKMTNEQPIVTTPAQPVVAPVKASPVKVEPKKEAPTTGNGQVVTNGSSDTNGNSIHDTQENTGKGEAAAITADDILLSGKLGIKARAMYDYEAADDTEISFDPDDIIGFIEKVDPGWWHGSVVTGRFKGRSGLFPANHVAEL